MKIVIDARMIKPGSMHGIARYVYQLLVQIRLIESVHEFVMLTNPRSPLSEISWPSHMSVFEISADWISFREQWDVPRALKQLGANLFHAPSFVAPLICPCRLVMTIHDLNHMVLPQFYTPLHQFYYQTFVRNCIKRSEYILTVSNFSKEEIVRNLYLNPDKVAVTYNGVSENYIRVTERDRLAYIRDLYELPAKFVFCLSNNKPHKNVLQLVKAYCYSDLAIPLVLASPVDRTIIGIAEKYGKKHLIFFSKFIDEEHLPTVYSLTELFVYPSTYEGFGLPPLEAIACGTPVVVARSSSLPEVVGTNAIFVDPYDYQDISQALTLGVNNTALRASLQERGVEHAKKFKWSIMANQTLEIYDKCLQGTNRTPAGVRP